MILPNGISKPITLHDILYVPKLTYNLLSVSKASRNGKILKFTKGTKNTSCLPKLVSWGAFIS